MVKVVLFILASASLYGLIGVLFRDAADKVMKVID